MADRSSRPHSSPRRTPAPVVRRIVHLRWKQRLGPVEIAVLVGLAPSTVHQVLLRCRINRLTHLDRVSGEPIRRYEHDHPGALIHLDVKKLAGSLLVWAHSFVGNEIHNQLAAEQIYFPAANSAAVAAPEFKAMRQYAASN